MNYGIFKNPSTVTSNQNDNDTLTLEKLKEISDFLNKKFSPEELFRAVIITNIFSPEEGAYKIKTKTGFYVFVRRRVWNSWLSSLEIIFPHNNSIPYFKGIPVYEDEVMAREIFREAVITPLTKTPFSDIILP